MKTKLGWALPAVFIYAFAVVSIWAGPSLPITKPPVQNTSLLTGPPPDPTAAQGQWFMRPGGSERPRSHEFYDDEAGAGGGQLSTVAITGHVSSITYQDGTPGNAIVAFTVAATIHNDHTMWAEPPYYNGNNSHGEFLSISGFESYIGTMYSTMLVAEFAVVDGETLPPQFTPPYRETVPLIHAVNEDQRAWYCWNPDDQNPEHDPKGDYYVPAWEFGDIELYSNATRQLDFAVPGGGLPSTDPRYGALVDSHATQADILLNRYQSLKISTWIDDVALDVLYGSPPPLRRSNASVFHDIEPAEEDMDYGDAPDPGYPTLWVNNGARHVVVPGVHMGLLIDAEPDGQPTLLADGDDLNNLADEDGVVFLTPLIAGQAATVQVTVSVSGYIHAWIDFDANGSWAETHDHIIQNAYVSTPGAHPFTFLVPGSAAIGPTYARFRFCTQQVTLNYDGLAPDGEVEDYRVFVEEDEEPPPEDWKWHQPPDLSQMGFDVETRRPDMPHPSPILLADDFHCTTNSTITHIVIWGSWYADRLPQGGDLGIPDPSLIEFTLSFHTDIPAGVEADWSMPGEVLWWETFPPGSFTVEIEADDLEEGWYDPSTGLYEPNADTICWRYTFPVDPARAFVQTGTVDNPVVYWLDVQAQPRGEPLEPGLDPRFGWKTTPVAHQWNDAAAWVEAVEPYDGHGWMAMAYPLGHPLYNPDEPAPFDLAFMLFGGPVPEEEPELDFGDAPDAPYPTLLASDGARHVVVPGVHMGLLIDAEWDGQPTLNADGDDLNNLADEDGVVFLTPLVAGQIATVQVTVSVSGYIHGWVDFDADGSWAETPDHILPGMMVPAGGVYQYPFAVPASAAIGNTYARFRFTTYPVALGFSGLALDGEVEDYRVEIRGEEEEPELDFGDAWDSGTMVGYPTLLANNGARHIIVPGVFLGAGVDAEPDGQPTPSADGDDMNVFFPGGIPYPPGDEDGVVIPSPLIAGDTVQVLVTASVPGYLNAWIDWNANVSWADPGEHVFINQPLVAGLNNLTLYVPLPPAIVAGGPHSRWRFTTYSVTTPTFTGLETDGEVEDYEVRLEVLDFGDAPDPYPTLLAQDGARHRIPSAYWMGPLAPDAEPDGQPTAGADGDDLNNLPDEDGVVLGSPLIRGQTANLLITASAPAGFLQAWFDFDADGNWSTPGDQIATDMLLMPGVNIVPVMVPSTAALGPTYARFRFGSELGILPTGLANDGEVEDYLFIIYQSGPSADIVITNITHSAADEMTIQWRGEGGVVYETQYLTDLLSTASPPWTAWGAFVERAPYEQADPAATETTKYYRVIAPYAPPPP